MINSKRLRELLSKFQSGNATEAETEELLQIINNEEYEEGLQKIWNDLPPDTRFFDEEKSSSIFQKILQSRPPARVISSAPTVNWKKITAVAALIAGLVLTTTYFLNRPPKELQSTAKIEVVFNDVPAPSMSNAVITLSDGTTVSLEDAANGSLAVQGNVTVEKLPNGEIIYQAKATTGPMSYNTLTVPRGSKVITIVLADGSKIWMNSGSSLRYPTAFTGKERRVEMTGEAYFDIAKSSKPFIVSRAEAAVRVYGTQFNVNAYDEEVTIAVTLIEGSVQVSKGTETSMLIPGQQAQVHLDGKIGLIPDADTEAATAWKNGYFQFTGNDIKMVMRQISRWYDVDIHYEGNIPERQFAGQMDRSNSLSKVLRILEESNVHFKLEGKKVTVMP